MQDRIKKMCTLTISDVHQTRTMFALVAVRRECCRPWALSNQIDGNDIVCIFESEVAGEIGKEFLLPWLHVSCDSQISLLNGSFVLRPNFLKKRGFDEG